MRTVTGRGSGAGFPVARGGSAVTVATDRVDCS